MSKWDHMFVISPLANGDGALKLYENFRYNVDDNLLIFSPLDILK